jgi:hypothetical protein
LELLADSSDQKVHQAHITYNGHKLSKTQCSRLLDDGHLEVLLALIKNRFISLSVQQLELLAKNSSESIRITLSDRLRWEVTGEVPTGIGEKERWHLAKMLLTDIQEKVRPLALENLKYIGCLQTS